MTNECYGDYSFCEDDGDADGMGYCEDCDDEDNTVTNECYSEETPAE